MKGAEENLRTLMKVQDTYGIRTLSQKIAKLRCSVRRQLFFLLILFIFNVPRIKGILRYEMPLVTLGVAIGSQ